MFAQDQLDELKAWFPGAECATEAGVTYFRLPDVPLPAGCDPPRMTLLLSPTAVGEYAYRLYFAHKVTVAKQLNWNASVQVLNTTWHAFSWKVPAGVRLAQMVAVLLRTLT